MSVVQTLVRPLSEETERIERLERDLQGLDVATALRVLDYVRSRVASGALITGGPR